MARWRRGHSGNQPYTQSAVMRSSIVAALGAQSILFISVGAIFFTGFWHCVGCRNTCRLAEDGVQSPFVINVCRRHLLDPGHVS